MKMEEAFAGPLVEATSVSDYIRDLHTDYIEENGQDIVTLYTNNSEGFTPKAEVSRELQRLILDAPPLDHAYNVYSMVEPQHYLYYKIGDVIEKPNFTSTTADRSLSLDQFHPAIRKGQESRDIRYCCLLAIKLSKRRGLVVSEVSVYPNQSEIILPMKSRFLLRDIRYLPISFYERSFRSYVRYITTYNEKGEREKKWFPQAQGVKVPDYPPETQYYQDIEYLENLPIFMRTVKVFFVEQL